MYIVTGGAGFIGANVVAGLNARGESDILVVDNLTTASKFMNLRDLRFSDYMDKEEFRRKLREGYFDQCEVAGVSHQGACSNTLETDGKYMMDNNFTCSKELFHFCAERDIPYVYASSAATYGNSTSFAEHPDNEKPLNVYGYSKLLFDQYCARYYGKIVNTCVGLRYFNVYGPREGHHKGSMASMTYQMFHELRETGRATLFEGSGGYGPGEQRRDFIHVDDVVAINLFFLESKGVQGAFNTGTGQSRSFNDIARILIEVLDGGEIVYRPMPEHIQGKYQHFTEADITKLREVGGYDRPFLTLEEGVKAYADSLLGESEQA